VIDILHRLIIISTQSITVLDYKSDINSSHVSFLAIQFCNEFMHTIPNCICHCCKGVSKSLTIVKSKLTIFYFIDQHVDI